MNILVIPEDFVKDQYMLKPIVTAIMKVKGKPRAKVTVCTDPRLQGVSQALQWTQIQAIIEQYRGMVDLFERDVKRWRRRPQGAMPGFGSLVRKSQSLKAGSMSGFYSSTLPNS